MKLQKGLSVYSLQVKIAGEESERQAVGPNNLHFTITLYTIQK